MKWPTNTASLRFTSPQKIIWVSLKYFTHVLNQLSMYPPYMCLVFLSSPNTAKEDTRTHMKRVGIPWSMQNSARTKHIHLGNKPATTTPGKNLPTYNSSSEWTQNSGDAAHEEAPPANSHLNLLLPHTNTRASLFLWSGLISLQTVTPPFQIWMAGS